jgi:restriction system protein
MFYRIILGSQNRFVNECLVNNFIGVNFDIQQDLTGRLPDNLRDFNHEFIPVFLQNRPDRTRIAAGLACGALWTVSKGLQVGDFVVCPNGERQYIVGEVIGNYQYQANSELPHRRPIRWFNQLINRDDMSQELKNSSGAVQTVCSLERFSDELNRLIQGTQNEPARTVQDGVESQTVFALERHLEDFLVANWVHTELGQDYEIYQQDGEISGQQFPTDTGPIDILAISRDRNRLLVVELKRGKARDVVAGQILRYMGYVREELAEPHQVVEGVIIALEDDLALRRALSIVPGVSFYRYQVNFTLNRI